MIFSSFIFVFGFLPLLVLCYFISPKKMKNYVLLIFSLFFYFWSSPLYALLLLVTVIGNYWAAIAIAKYEKRLILILAVSGNLLPLIYFKYFNFLITIINDVFQGRIAVINVLLPVGISFYTFQILSYLFDVYRKEVEVEKDFFKLLLYVCLFPQLMAGPIVRYRDLSYELSERETSFATVAAGLERFIYGLAKKMILANHLGQLADIIFDLSSLTTDIAWLGAVAYTLQIYFDFSAYSDMAIGLAKIFGFNYLENFNYPYIAKSITDFWRRWHISLSMWFRDYVYIPLGGKRRRQILNLTIVWFLTGLWHGAAFSFLLWGLYFLVFLLLEKYLLKIDKLPIINHLYTLFVVIISWVIFRSGSISGCMAYLKVMFVPTFKSFDWVIIYLQSYYPYLLGGLLLSTPFYPWFLEKVKDNCFLQIMKYVCLLILFVVTVAFMTRSTYNAFIYFRF